MIPCEYETGKKWVDLAIKIARSADAYKGKT